MAKKLAAHFRAVKEGKKDKDGNPTYELVHLRPGDDPSELPQEVQDQLESDGLLVDEKRLTANSLVRIPYGEPDREVAATEPMVTESRPNPQDHPDKGNKKGEDK